ncbi:MAG TPA: DUF2785 domain-containing protein [Anaerolineales bacterium]|nr:DUF2785 domain-containing protein [Anaerolineales bacterium]
MDKEFWVEISNNRFEIPAGYTLAELTRELFSYLGSTDPELRDDIGYTVFANWLKQERYSVEELRGFIKVLLANLDTGIGETENDSIFLRTFSILFLAEIIHNDNKKPILDEEEVTSILEKSLWYVTAEMDPRGYIPVKGWAHALAHAADLLLVLGKNKHLEEKDLLKILNTISEKFIGSINYIYIHGEDERLASAVVQALRRGLLSIENAEIWAKSLNDHDWKGAYTNEEQTRAFHNTRNLLRSIYLELIKNEEKIHEQGSLEKIFLDTLNNLKPF